MAQVPTGVLVDRLGPRRIVALGGVVAGAGSVVFGRAATLGGASVGRALVGLGVSVTFVSLLKLVGAWFREEEFATLSGVVMFLGNLGAVLSSTPLAWAVGVTSWRNVFVAVGLSSLAGAALTWLFVRDTPGDAGLPSMRALDGRAEHAPHPGRWWEGLWIVLRNRATWPGLLREPRPRRRVPVVRGAVGGAVAHDRPRDDPHARDRPHDRDARLVRALVAAFGRISDRLGRRRAPAVAIAAVQVLCWIPVVLGVPLAACPGFALFALMGASATGFTLSWASVKEVNPPALSGTAMAVVNIGVFLGPTLYQPLVGWVLDRAGFPAALAVLAACAAAGLGAALLVQETWCRNVSAGAAAAGLSRPGRAAADRT